MKFETWISNHTKTPFMARTEFSVNKAVKSAKAKVCGLGQFVFYMNGEKVSDHELDPAWTDYDKQIQYVEFDVAEMILQGINCAAAEVGNGWYHKTDEHYTFVFPEFMPPNPNPYKPFGPELVLAAVLELDYEDGTSETVIADESWKTAPAETVMSNVYGSETIDMRLRQKGWNTPGFDDSSWKYAGIVSEENKPKGKAELQVMPPVKVIHTYEAEKLHFVNGRDIYDLGQNCSGMLDFEIYGHRGDEIRLYPAEKLAENGDVDQVAKNWVTVDSCITVIVGEDEAWQHCRMKFTYFAGRYFAVEAVSKNGGSLPKIRNLQGDAISSAHNRNGSFLCDDDRYNKIYDMIERTVEANMVSVHTDCPTIERFAWQEPNHLLAPSVFYMKDGSGLWRKFLEDMRLAQHTKEDYFNDLSGGKFYPGDGLMPSQCPCYIPNVLPVPGMGSFYDIITWGSTSILGTAWHYKFYGDKEIIRENYEAGKKYFSHLLSKRTEEGFINHGLGDWGNPDGEFARENAETAILYADAVTLKDFAEILEKEDDFAFFEKTAEEIRENYNDRLLVQDEKGRWCYRSYEHKDELVMTQACEAMPLYWGMVPEDKTEDVANALKDTLTEKGAICAGEVGLPYIIQAAADHGMNDLIHEYITKPEHPSYYAFVLDGMTTLGEYWESNPRSHCHDMMGHIIEWYYNSLAGIRPLEPGFKKVLIRPWLPESMNEMTCTYDSAAGKIEVKAERKNGHIDLAVNCDDNIEVTVDRSLIEA